MMHPSEAAPPLITHLVELRRRLLWSVAFWLAAFLGLYYFSGTLYQLLSRPLLAVLPADAHMVATGITAPFLAPFKLTLATACFVSVPFFFYQLWQFIAPGLYRHERHGLWRLLCASTGLFYLGCSFAYFVVFPLMFRFFAHIVPGHVTFMPDISAFLDFALRMLFVFGLAFQVPIITWVVVRLNWVSHARLAKGRAYVVLFAFVLGMLLTPPDVISQVLLALPIWLLYEVGLFFSKP